MKTLVLWINIEKLTSVSFENAELIPYIFGALNFIDFQTIFIPWVKSQTFKFDSDSYIELFLRKNNIKNSMLNLEGSNFEYKIKLSGKIVSKGKSVEEVKNRFCESINQWTGFDRNFSL
eukprot:NODE_212_length_12593_cov_0.662638.p10 type:complete len:119 gc:universal NODE_212_length_12593_cov_0.662638:8182-8538(+)